MGHPVLGGLGAVLQVAAGGGHHVHVGDGSAVADVPARGDDGVDLGPVEAGVLEGQVGRLEDDLVVALLGLGGLVPRLPDPHDGDSAGHGAS